MAPPAVESPVVMSTHGTESSRDNKTSHERRTYIARLFLAIQDSLRELGVDTEDDETIHKMELMSVLIHESMSISSRNYHSVQHVFDISHDLKDPIAILAALFHDCIYYNIDGGLSAIQGSKLQGVLLIDEETPEVLRIHPEASKDALLDMVIQVYGLKAGQELLPMMGLNEFLSAIICVRELESLLPMVTLTQLACCIEMTIPFRPKHSESGLWPADRLFDRLASVNENFGLDMTEAARVEAVQRAVILANNDVGNFGSDDIFWFLDNTWSLLPESNVALRREYLYTVKEFQFAVFKMNGFFNFLKPEVVFSQFRGVPSDAALAKMNANCARNLEIGKRYVAAKLLSISVLAAFAQLTGGDAPISLFMGDLPSRNRVSRRLEDTLPTPPAAVDHCDPDVYEILAHGRRRETSFDVKQSPLAAYFYSVLGDEELERILGDVKVYPMQEESAKLLLARLPRAALQQVATNMAPLASSRIDLIRTIADQLEL